MDGDGRDGCVGGGGGAGPVLVLVLVVAVERSASKPSGLELANLWEEAFHPAAPASRVLETNPQDLCCKS